MPRRSRHWAARATAAQFLPSRIVQRIADYAAAADDGYRDSSGCSQSAHDHLSRAALQLGTVCRSWRVAVLALFYRHFALDINCTAMWISPYRRMVHTACPRISDNVKHLARAVHITAPFAGVFNGKVVQILDASGHGSAAFPGVQSLWFNFYAGATMQIEEIDGADRAIQDFSRYITALCPNAAAYHFRVSLFADSDDSSMVGRLLSALLAARSAHPPTTVEYVHESRGVRLHGLTSVRGLTHISIKDIANAADCINLVRSNAATLVAVDLGIVDAYDCLPRLTADDDGLPIWYPRLQSLSVPSNLAPKDTATAFPVLRHLHRTTGSLFVANEPT
ncbi:hypothetical protein H4R19_002197 [Coemansia spiralis]|nr:hypothetical protein H4R19_002197 [Coemansia spiralis]